MYQFDREAYNKRMEWYQHDRFGMFIHYGLYSIPARGEWIRSIEEISKEDYMKYFDEFDARDYNPKQWAKEAREAGMKYMVLTVKHHDGFCLYDSKYTDFKATNTKAGRDLVTEFVEAVRGEGLKVGLYFTLLDWYDDNYPHYGDRIHPMRNHPECSNENRDFSKYVSYFHKQIEEICTNYGKLDLLWMDFSYDDMRGEKWGATELMDMVRRLQPDVIIDNRLEVSGEGRGSLAECSPTPYHGDFVTPEQMIPPEGILDVEGNPMAWEACVTMNNNWGYCANDHYFKPASMLIKKLVECVSKGGNMLLNVGPDAYGKFPEESSKILKEMGQWMKRNHESIYGCGRADIERPDYGKVTKNGNKYYFHIYENSIGPVPLPGLKKSAVKKIRALYDGTEVPVSTSWVHSDYPDMVFADLGPNPVLPDPVDYVLEVEMIEE
ncbi:MAG: alpha-L-fucosidase [Lachnospiraceae bacterium]|nr:alpha-L-fucosidase [Lachnospiraceae bacterium]